MDKEIPSVTKIRRKFFRLFWYLVLALLLTIAGFIFIKPGNSMYTERSGIQIYSVQKQDFFEYIPLNGHTISARVTVVNPIVGGIIEDIYHSDGDSVCKGDTLIKLRNPDLELEYMQRELQIYDVINNLQNSRLNLEQQSLLKQIELEELRCRFTIARDDYERKQFVFNSQLIAEADFARIKTEKGTLEKQMQVMLTLKSLDSVSHINQIRQINNSINRLNKNLNILRSYLNNLYILSPVSGIVSGLQPQPGQMINAGQQLCSVDEESEKKVRALIDERFIQQISTGRQAIATFDGKEYTLRLEQIFLEPKDGAYELEFSFDGLHPPHIKTGQGIQLQLLMTKSESLVVLKKVGQHAYTQGDWVYVLDKDEKKARKRHIKTRRENMDFLEVTEGLQEGDKVIISSYEAFGDKEILIFE